jgi:hypothetical protein
LILMDAYPARQAAAVGPASGDAPPGNEAIPEELRPRFAQIYQADIAIRRGHKPGMFRGRALLLVATEGRPVSQSSCGPWEPYITGPVTEVPIACEHEEMARPANLAQAWQAISAWTAL